MKRSVKSEPDAPCCSILSFTPSTSDKSSRDRSRPAARSDKYSSAILFMTAFPVICAALHRSKKRARRIGNAAI